MARSVQFTNTGRLLFRVNSDGNFAKPHAPLSRWRDHLIFSSFPERQVLDMLYPEVSGYDE